MAKKACKRSSRRTPTSHGRDTHATLRTIRSIPRLPARPRDAHKGNFGRVLVVGGCRGMVGAPALAANAALRGGAGLVTVACPRSIQLAVATLCPCATSIPLPERGDGMIDPRRAIQTFRTLGLLGDSSAPPVVAAGPGLGRGGDGFDRAWLGLLGAFGEARVPAVVDADGLNAMHESSAWRGPGWDTTPHFRTVITPHPGEMARLHQTTAEAVQGDRAGFAVGTAERMSNGGRANLVAPASRRCSVADFRAVVVLKGAGSLVTDGVGLYKNKSGNPGMATGGSGDVLTGVIAALIGQGMSTIDAAVLGVHLHGLAGDLAARDLGAVSLTATDLIEYLPAAFRRLPKA